MTSEFLAQVEQFNKMYGLPVHHAPAPVDPEAMKLRLTQLRKILMDEVAEVDEIIEGLSTKFEIETLTELSDWLGDIIVYCASEAMRHGIPLRAVLDVIMQSNFSKLGADGQPIIADGKVQKGPGYWKPEPTIQVVLMAAQESQDEGR